MKIDRLASDSSSGGLRQGWNRFWFSPVEAMQLHRLRVLAGLVFLVWMLAFANQQGAFLSLQGWFDRDAYLELSRKETLVQSAPAPVGWSIFYLADGNGSLFQALYWGSVAIIALFTLGVAPRLTSILTWVVVVSITANPAVSFDADFLMVILAFYLMVGYAFMGLWQSGRSPLERILGPHDALVFTWFRKQDRAPASRSYAANFAIRMLQVHFAVILVASGVTRLQIPDWWAGVAYWYPLHPPFQTTAESYAREQGYAPLYLAGLSLAQYIALAWQIGFPAFAWRGGRWRVVLIGGGVIDWLGSLFLLGLPLFGPFYFIGCLSYLRDEEWRRLSGWFGNRAGRGAEKPFRAAADANKIKVGTQ